MRSGFPAKNTEHILSKFVSYLTFLYAFPNITNGLNFSTDNMTKFQLQIEQMRSEVNAAWQEHEEEVQKPGQGIKWTPELNMCVTCSQLNATKSVGPSRKNYNHALQDTGKVKPSLRKIISALQQQHPLAHKE